MSFQKNWRSYLIHTHTHTNAIYKWRFMRTHIHTHIYKTDKHTLMCTHRHKQTHTPMLFTNKDSYHTHICKTDNHTSILSLFLFFASLVLVSICHSMTRVPNPNFWFLNNRPDYREGLIFLPYLVRILVLIPSVQSKWMQKERLKAKERKRERE